jgi:hypothetical protein
MNDTEESLNLPEYINYNKNKISSYLKRLRITKLKVTYSGSGDSGALDEVIVLDKNGGEKGTLEDYKNVSTSKIRGLKKSKHPWAVYLGQNTPEEKEEENELGLKDAVEELFYMILEHRYGGWEINDGSNGEFNWDIESEKINWTHTSYYTESSEHEHLI